METRCLQINLGVYFKDWEGEFISFEKARIGRCRSSEFELKGFQSLQLHFLVVLKMFPYLLPQFYFLEHFISKV